MLANTSFFSIIFRSKHYKMNRGGNKSSSNDDSVFRIAPYFYLHVLDQNSNVTKVETGPKTYIRQDNEKVRKFAVKIPSSCKVFK